MWHEWSTLEKLIWLRRRIGGGASWVWQTITGSAPLTLANAVSHDIRSLTQYGLCTQSTTPTPDAPVDIVCNNGVLRYSANMANVNEQTARVGYYINAQGAVLADQYNWFYQDFISVNPNTTYTLSMSVPVYYVTISEYSAAADSGFIIRKTGTTGGNTSLTITTGDNTNFLRFGANLNRVAVTLEMVLSIDWMLNIGTAMEYQPYVEGGIYTDGTPEVLTVRGKNLFDKDNMPVPVYTAYISNSSGEGRTRLVSGTSEQTVLMPIEPNTTYTVTKVYTDRLRIAEFPTIPKISPATSGTLLASDTSDAQRTERTITTGATAAYLAIQINNARLEGQSTTLDAVLASLQVEEGSTATDYEPYHAPQTVSVPMLLSVDTVKDEWEAIYGPKTVRIGLYVIKGSDDEGWSENQTYSGTFYADCLPQAVKHPAMSLFTRYKGVDSTTSVAGMTNGTAKCGSSSNRQRIFIRDVSCADADALKAKLSGFYADGEPCIVAFALATETTEQTQAHALHTSAGTNVVDMTANVSPVELEVEYASNN